MFCKDERRRDVNFPELRDDAVSFHMPGHKGRLIFFDVPNDFLKYDVTELPEMDNLIQPETWIKELTKRLSDFYGSEASRISVGGSTACILSAILGSANYYEEYHEKKSIGGEGENATPKAAPKAISSRGVHALINRNAHISVYNAVEISGVDAQYFAPEEREGIPSHFDTDAFLSLINEETDILVLTYPFYQGGLYDIETMMQLARMKSPNITIIVDEAHGAHLVLEELVHGKKMSTLSLGADIVIQSLHKTLPVLGQAAVLHYGRTKKGRELAAQRGEVHSIEWYMKALQTTSPSYLILKSISQMMEVLESQGVQLYQALLRNIDRFYERTGLKPFDYRPYAVQDRSKLLLPFSNQASFIERGIYPEMELEGRILFLSSIANTESDFDRLAEVTLEHLSSGAHAIESSSADVDFAKENPDEAGSALKGVSLYERSLLRYGTRRKREERGHYVEMRALDAIGMRSAETLVLYPPGSPLVLSGEILRRDVAEMLGETKVNVYLPSSV